MSACAVPTNAQLVSEADYGARALRVLPVTQKRLSAALTSPVVAGLSSKVYPRRRLLSAPTTTRLSSAPVVTGVLAFRTRRALARHTALIARAFDGITVVA